MRDTVFVVFIVCMTILGAIVQMSSCAQNVAAECEKTARAGVQTRNCVAF